MVKDPIINELHKIREEHFKEFDGNSEKLLSYWLTKKKNPNKKYVNFEKETELIKTN
jgi:hypothetical protein